MKNRTLLIISILLLGLSLFGCSSRSTSKEAQYHLINAEQAKKMMDEESDYLIIDVRRIDEYETEHIPKAINIPNEVIAKEAEEKLKDKDQLLLIYCRSGRRSKEAAMKLVDLGYTNVYDFGGILDWTYGTES